MNVFEQLVLRISLIIAITDIVIFWVIQERKIAITPFFVAEVIVVTIIPCIISLWWCLGR